MTRRISCKKLGTIAKYALMLLALCIMSSCTRTQPRTEKSINISGNAAESLSKEEVKTIEGIEMGPLHPIYYIWQREKHKAFKNKELNDSVPLELNVRIDSVLAIRDYMDNVESKRYTSANIEVYLEPKVIKGSVPGKTDYIVRGQLAKDYFTIQKEYNEDGDIAKAVANMSELLTTAHDSITIFRNNCYFEGIGGLDGFVEKVLSLLRPRSNFWGKLIAPSWFLSVNAARITSSIKYGFYLLVALFVVLFYFLIKVNIRLDKTKLSFSLIAVSILTLLCKILMILTFLSYSYYLCRPGIENILAIENAYHWDVSFIGSRYLDYTYSPPKLAISIITIVLFLLKRLIDNACKKIIQDTRRLKAAVKVKQKEVKAVEEALLKGEEIPTFEPYIKEEVPEISEPPTDVFPMLLACCFLDRLVVLSFMFIYIIVLSGSIMSFYNLYKNGYSELEKEAKKYGID